MRLYHFTTLLMLCVPSLAARSFDGSGTYIVGVDIEAGTYRSGIGPNGHCYWERVSDLSGELSDTIANELVQQGTVIVEIKPSDYAFKTRECTDWMRVDVTRSSVRYRGLAGAQARDSQTPPLDTKGRSDKLWRKELE